MNNFKTGDIIVSDLDGNEYEIVKFDTRNNLEPIPGVNLLGMAAVVKDSKGTKQLIYEWEMQLKERS